jgi:phage shock protein PspC (stress-responsive transcriptional regulator)
MSLLCQIRLARTLLNAKAQNGRSCSLNNSSIVGEKEEGMSVYKKLSLIAATFWLTAQTAFAAGGGDVQSIVIVADSRKLSGVMAWWANLYNESHLYFTLLTVILIPLIGVIFGVLADIVMHFIGIDLSSRDLAEH